MDYVLIKAINDDGSKSFREVEIRDTPTKQGKIAQVPYFVSLLEADDIEVFKITDYQIITSDGTYVVATEDELRRVLELENKEEVHSED